MDTECNGGYHLISCHCVWWGVIKKKKQKTNKQINPLKISLFAVVDSHKKIVDQYIKNSISEITLCFR